MCVFVCVFVCVRVCVCVCVCVCACVMNMCMTMCMYVCMTMRVCMCVCVCEGVPPATRTLEPHGMPDPFYTGLDPTVNLAPTQSLYHFNCSVQLRVGDHLFLRPSEADAMLTFAHMRSVRGGHLSGLIPTYRGGIH